MKSRIARVVVFLVIAILPTPVVWLACLQAVTYRAAPKPAVQTPNPPPAPAGFMGPAEILVYVDPRLAAGYGIWVSLSVTAIIAGTLGAGFVRSWWIVIGGALLLGLVLAGPWLYSLVRILTDAG